MKTALVIGLGTVLLALCKYAGITPIDFVNALIDLGTVALSAFGALVGL